MFVDFVLRNEGLNLFVILRIFMLPDVSVQIPLLVIGMTGFLPLALAVRRGCRAYIFSLWKKNDSMPALFLDGGALGGLGVGLRTMVKRFWALWDLGSCVIKINFLHCGRPSAPSWVFFSSRIVPPPDPECV